METEKQLSLTSKCVCIPLYNLTSLTLLEELSSQREEGADYKELGGQGK